MEASNQELKIITEMMQTLSTGMGVQVLDLLKTLMSALEVLLSKLIFEEINEVMVCGMDIL